MNKLSLVHTKYNRLDWKKTLIIFLYMFFTDMLPLITRAFCRVLLLQIVFVFVYLNTHSVCFIVIFLLTLASFDNYDIIKLCFNFDINIQKKTRDITFLFVYDENFTYSTRISTLVAKYCWDCRRLGTLNRYFD